MFVSIVCWSRWKTFCGGSPPTVEKGFHVEKHKLVVWSVRATVCLEETEQAANFAVKGHGN